MANWIELNVDQGTNQNVSQQIIDSNTGAPSNIVGCIITSNAKTSYVTTDVALNIGCVITDGPNGKFSMVFTPNTINMQYGKYYYDVKKVDTSNNTTRVIEGVLFINPNVT